MKLPPRNTYNVANGCLITESDSEYFNRVITELVAKKIEAIEFSNDINREAIRALQETVNKLQECLVEALRTIVRNS